MQQISMKEAREIKNLTQADVANKLGFTTPQFISNIERNKAKVPKKHFKKLAKVVGRAPVLGLIEQQVQSFRQSLLKALG